VINIVMSVSKLLRKYCWSSKGDNGE